MNDSTWFHDWKKTPDAKEFALRPIAYFCAEFALTPTLPTYAGGLGVLAGDVIREAADQGVPMVGMGLYYHHSYLCTHGASEHEPMAQCASPAPETVGLTPVKTKDDELIVIYIPYEGRRIAVRAWQWTLGGVRVYLLDTNCKENSFADRHITGRLYVGEKETRFKQELVLGIGGLRILQALGIHPSVYHLNEGHSAMLGLELIHHEMKERSLGWEAAIAFARRRVVLTNHTLVSAGHDVYSDDLASLSLTSYAEDIGVPVTDIIKLGLVQESNTFSMTMLALRLASVVNAVSKLHAEKAADVWHDHPMVPITNGIHTPTWDQLGHESARPGALWKKHTERKTELLAEIKKLCGRDWAPNTLLIGWARRIVSYKRPVAAFHDVGRFMTLARATGREVRIVFAGAPHPTDEEGIALMNELRTYTDGELKDVACFLPRYGLHESLLLTSGCDVWLNTPIVGFEACGTSGMKAGLNGVLPCTTKDGWAAEADIPQTGWFLGSERVSDEFLETLEHQIVPLYYDRDAKNIPLQWELRMRATRTMILDGFSATRMLRQYIETLYT